MLYQVIITPDLIVSSSHCVVPISYVTVLLSHLVVSFIFLTFDDFILTLCSCNVTFDSTFVTFGGFFFFNFFYICWFHPQLYSSNITFDIFLSHLVVPLFFFLTFNGSILILCSSNITRDNYFVTFGGFFFFFI